MRYVCLDGALERVLAEEDLAEDVGTLAPDDRLTCHTCRAWATEEHVASDSHQRATGTGTWLGT